ncbi:hypothetical protein [Nisaea sp.]|uniref:hypothetical protein n=1 Tax=Nisaea sp. TaxID=2024842 RepID=UPI0032ED2DAE
MRSRHRAFSRGSAAYLQKSWAAETRSLFFTLCPAQLRAGLTSDRHAVTGPDTVCVCFTALRREGARTGRPQSGTGVRFISQPDQSFCTVSNPSNCGWP